jgi:hypothetical protein
LKYDLTTRGVIFNTDQKVGPGFYVSVVINLSYVICYALFYSEKSHGDMIINMGIYRKISYINRIHAKW